MIRRKENKEVASFLYDLLITNAPSKDYARKVCEKMGVPYPTMARYWQGRAVFPAGLVRALFVATDNDIRVAELFLLEGSGYKLERDEDDPDEVDIPRAVLHLNTLEGEISRLYLQATHEDSESGHRISFAEARELEAGLRKLNRTAEDLRAIVRKRYLQR